MKLRRQQHNQRAFLVEFNSRACLKRILGYARKIKRPGSCRIRHLN